MEKRSPQLWQKRAERRLKLILQKAEQNPAILRLGPKAKWHVEIQLVNRSVMQKLNHEYRGKDYPTDVLSYPSLSPFRDQGVLGELIVCMPVCRAQAKALGHTPEQELDVLTVHGVLHLLGLDHERSPQEAKKMAKLEAQLLQHILPNAKRSLGLIDRVYSGTKKK